MGPAFPELKRMSIKLPSYIARLSVYTMSTSLQVLFWTWCITTLGLTEDVPDGVPILKEINRVNDDGSYTFGYEAADGSFKIETRDVQGNVKGMFGYIDEAGELKRVSYTANNGTGYQTVSTTGKPNEKDDITTKRPVFILRQPTSTRAPVIQHIPRRSIKEGTSQSTTTPAYGEYINGRKPVMEIIINSATSNLEENQEPNQDVRSTPTPPPLRRILVTRRPVVEETTTVRQGKGGNALRRQLANDQLSRPADTPDVYPDTHSRLPTQASRFQNPLLSSLLPEATPAYRNHILSQNPGRIPPYLLRPDYPHIDPTYQPPFDPHEPPEITTTVAPVPQPFPNQHRLYPEGQLPHGPIARKFRPNLPLDEQQYPITNGQDPRRYRPIQNIPQISPVLQQRPMYPSDNDYNQAPQISAVQSLRDELMEYLLQYLQQRSGRAGPGFANRLPISPQYPYNPYNHNQYPNQNQYFPNPQVPYNQYPNQYGPYSNQNSFYNPYINQNFPFQAQNPIYPNTFPPPQPFVPPIGVPPGLPPGNPYSNVPYNNPNIQYSPQQQVSQQSVPSQNYSPHITEARIGNPLYRNARPPNTNPENDISQQELFKMLVAASTRATPTQSYTVTTEGPKSSTHPVRNVQILGAASETVTQRVLSDSSLGSTIEPLHKVTVPTPVEDEMEQIS